MGTFSATQLTPVESRGRLHFKRDDMFQVFGVRGGKVRACLTLAQGARGIVCAASRKSPQLCYAAAIAEGVGIPCLLFTASGEPTPEMEYAAEHGAAFTQIRPGYSNVVLSRAAAEAERRKAKGWRLIPFGMECDEAVELTARQVANIPPRCKRIVAVAGSGLTVAGILRGLRRMNMRTPVLGVKVGADPVGRLNEWAEGWEGQVELVDCGLPYAREARDNVLEGITLDPIYEAKCIPFLEPGDLFWIVGIRPTAEIAPRKWRAQ